MEWIDFALGFVAGGFVVATYFMCWAFNAMGEDRE